MELTNFSVDLENDDAMITWNTYSETDNDYFVVERAMDGINFISIGMFAGAGSTSLLQQYQFEDSKVQPGVNYYRIAAVSLDGEETWSEVRSIERSVEDVVLFPNPVSDHVNLYLPSAAHVSILNTVGERLTEQSLEVGNNRIDLNDIASGTYAVQVSSQSGITTRLIYVQ